MQEAFQKWSLSGEFLDGGLDLGIRIQRQQVLSTFIQAWWTPACYCHPHFVLFCFLDEELHSLTYICVLSHHQNDLACQSDGASSRLKTPPMVPADSPDSALSSYPFLTGISLILEFLFLWLLSTLFSFIGQPRWPFRFLFRGSPLQEVFFPHPANADTLGSSYCYYCTVLTVHQTVHSPRSEVVFYSRL